jgi:uncharacterized protein (DUF2225 family)
MMVITHDIEVSCPICGTRVEIRELGGCIAKGQDSDLLVRMDGPHAIQIEINTCPRCRFSGYPDEFAASLGRAQVERFISDLVPRLAADSRPVQPDSQYLWAYRCGSFLGQDDGSLGLKLLRAYWCLRLPPSNELSGEELAERRGVYLKGAVHHLRLDVRGEGVPARLYILAELCRRAGDFPAAAFHFKKFLDTANRDESVPRYLRLAAIKLLRAAERSQDRDMTMEEIVYADSAE